MDAQDYKHETGYTFHDAENQEILRKFVDREVDHNIPRLVNHFVQNPEALNGSDYDYDEILDLCEIRNYEDAARDGGCEKALFIEGQDTGAWKWIYYGNDGEYQSADILLDSEQEAYEDFCRTFDIEPHIDEIFEHYIISDFLGRELEEKGEVVSHDFFNLTVWGRGCTGQAIYMDGVIGEIAAEMEILKGQRLEW